MADHAILTTTDHGELRIDPRRGVAFGDAVMSCIVVPSEFRRVQNEYPILFRLTPERDRFEPLALFGFEAGENLYIDANGWRARYRPLAMEIRPFLIGRAATPGGDRQIHVDTASARIARDGDGVRVFDEFGRPTPYFETVIEQLGELDAGWQELGDFFAALTRHELLEPLTIEITLDDGSTNRLVGYHAINEERLQELDAPALGDLTAAGYLMPVFMAVASLSNLARLIARKNAAVARG